MRSASIVCVALAVVLATLPDDGEACPRLFRGRIVMPCQPGPWQLVLPVAPAPSAAIVPERVQAPREFPFAMFGGSPQRNMVNLIEKNLPTEWDVNPKKPVNFKWVAQLGTRAFGAPVVADGRVFIGTNNMRPRDPLWDKIEKNSNRPVDLGVLMCFRESDGKFLWQAVHQKLPGGQVVDWPLEGIGSTPTVEGERLYYASNRCELICASVHDGKAIWTLDMIGKLGVFPHNRSICAPLIVDDRVYVVTSNGVNEDHLTIPAPQAPSFLAVNKLTGAVVWKDNSPTLKLLTPPADGLKHPELFKYLVNRGELLMHGQWSNAAAATVNGEPLIIFPGGDGWLYAFKLDGTMVWKFDCNPKNAKFNLRTGERSDFMGTPVVFNNRVYVGVGQDPEHRTAVGRFWCIDITKRGDVSPELRDAADKIVPNPNSAMVWHYGGVLPDPATMRKLRRNYYFGRTLSTAAIHDGLVYIPDLDGILHCLDADTGKSHWEFNTKSEIWASPFYADGKVYLGTDDKEMWVLEAGKTRKVLAENEMDGRIRTPPVASNGVLFVATEDKLYAIAQPK